MEEIYGGSQEIMLTVPLRFSDANLITKPQTIR